MEFGLEIIYHSLSSISHFDLEFSSLTAFSSVFEALHAHKLPCAWAGHFYSCQNSQFFLDLELGPKREL